MKVDAARKVPNFRLSTPGGNSITLETFHGQKTALFLWAAYHKSRELLPIFDKLKGVQKVAIAFDVMGVEPVMRFAIAKNIKSLILIDNCCLLSRLWSVKKLPLLLMLDEQGTPVGDPVNFPVKPLREVKSDKSSEKIELLMQYVTNLLGRKKIEEALGTMKKALDLDPRNQIISDQFAVLRSPEKFYKE
jgi:hypothetical protein